MPSLSLNNAHEKARDAILTYMPRDAEVTRIEFEGPTLAIYVKNADIILDQSYIVTDIVNALHKRVVIRSDPSIRMDEANAEKVIKSLIPQEAGVTGLLFDGNLGEVAIEARKPGLAIGREGVVLQEILRRTRWRPRVVRAPLIPSRIISTTRHVLHSEGEERGRILRDVGERIFRPTLKGSDYVNLTVLGSAKEVGRSALLVETKESMVLVDCGVNPSSNDPSQAYPRLDDPKFDLERLDAVVISHPHIDHCAMTPFLYKYGYDGPVYCSEPTAYLMTLLQLDYLDVAAREGVHPPYDQRDVKNMVLHTMPLKYGVVTDIAPDIKLTLHNAGHILGSSIVHLHIGEGFHNIVYTGDFKFGETMLLEPASTIFPRVETLIIESTYGGPEDVMPERDKVEEEFTSMVGDTIKEGGKVLIPVPAVGRAQEIMLVLDRYIREGVIPEVPIFIEGMISEATAIHTAYPEYLAREVRNQILKRDVNPFESEYFTIVSHPSDREEIVQGGPSVILATSGMLEGGPVIDYFRHLAPEEKNSIIFVSYQIEGTLGARVKNGLKEVSIAGQGGRMEVIKINAKVHMVEGFSGHSDRKQLLRFVRKITPKPQRILVIHGEKRKCEGLAESIRDGLKIEASAPEIGETVKLR
ncbi:MAG: beta-CASP ribonuclease aCPSF1 [Candidatus Bathyarchaeia archaeon]